jgi:hypothetical protein
MKKIFSILCLLILGIASSAQPFAIEWQNCFGDSRDERAMDLVKTNDGYLIASIYPSIETKEDILLIKVDKYGNEIWKKRYGGSDYDGVVRIFPTIDDSGFLLVGRSASSDGDISNDPYPDSQDYWIVKINNSGDILWQKIYGGSDTEYPITGVTTFDKGILAYGNTYSNDGDISQYFGKWDSWMIKLDSTGNKVWDFTIGNSGTSFATDIIETSDHGLLVSSVYYPGIGGNIECEPYNLNADIVVVKTDSSANVEWQECYKGSAHETTRASIEVSDGYILACEASSNDGDVAGAGYHVGYQGAHNQYPTSDIWLLKIDFSGNIIWTKCYGGSKNEFANRIFPTDDGGFIVFGETGSYDGDVTGNHSSGPPYTDIWVIKVNSVGDLLWQQCFGGNGFERLWAGVVDNGDGSYVIASTINDFNSGQVNCPTTNGSKQIWLIKITDTTTVGINERIKPEAVLKVYPNPANGYVVFETVNRSTGLISITDIFGRLVAEVSVKELKTVWDTKGVRPGVYLYHLNNGMQMTSGKIMITN